jgi:TonB family protein
MKHLSALLLALITLPCSYHLLRAQDTLNTVPPPARNTTGVPRSGDTLDGIIYYLRILPADTSRPDRMPVVPPSDYTVAESQPVPLKMVRPELPDSRKTVKGTVWVKCLIGTDGRVKKAEVMKADSETLIEPALRAAKEWLFTPAKLNGKPVETWAAIPFRFGGARR